MLANNAGCRLPCWWGIVPGQTSWQEAKQFLKTFIPEIEQGGSGGGITNFDLHFAVDEGDIGGYYVIYVVKNGTITDISAFPPVTEKSFLLHQVLTTYGQPAEVVIQTFPNTPIGYLPFWLILYYPEQGIYAFYEYHAQKQGNVLLGCPQPIGPELYLWDPAEQMSLDRINAFVLGEPLWTPRPLADVTDFDLKGFYETFRQGSNTTCLETPAEIWP